MTIFTLNSKLTFGKYKGKKLEEVADLDPQYLLWCRSNIEWVDFPEDVVKSLVLMAAADRYLASGSRFSNSGFEDYDHDMNYDPED